MKDKEKGFLDASQKIAESVYIDGAKKFIQESGKVISLVPEAINAILVPMRKWIVEKEYSLQETQLLLEKKLKNIDVNDIVEPEKYVAVPALQAISYSMNNETLRNMYANLLAKSMNKNTKDEVHPSFVEIIKQMSPADAVIFNEIFNSSIKPTIDLSISIDNIEGEQCHIYNITWISTYEYNTVAISISNLIRIGLIEINKGVEYTHDENYEKVRHNPKYIEYYKNYEKVQRIKVNENKQCIKITALGELFYKICVKS